MAVAVVSAAVTLVWLTLWLLRQGQVGAERANVLALPVEIVGALLAGITLGFALKPPRPSPPAVDLMRRLMRLIRKEQQRFIDQALGVQWKTEAADVTFADPESGTLPTGIETLLVNWQDVDGKRAGSIKDVADFYSAETNGRLVILGAPGSGKSVLLSHLVRDLVDRLPEPNTDRPPDGWRLPIMISMRGCDLINPEVATEESPTEQSLAARLDAWIVDRLVDDYQVPIAEAKALVSDQRILPVLDGLDEMDPTPADSDPQLAPAPRAAAVIQALNAERTPVVLACRDPEYQSLTVDAGDGEALRRPGLLTDARHVVLRPLPAQDVIDYLTDRFGSGTRALPNRWQAVADTLNAGEPLLSVLENPWQLFLAVNAYGQETSDPAELVRMTPHEANEHLLSALIPAVTDRDDTANVNGWTAQDVQHWLTSIADNQSRWWHDSMTDIRVPDLWTVANEPFDFGLRALIREWITPIIASAPTLLMSLAFIVVGFGDRGGFLFVGVLLALMGLTFGLEAYGYQPAGSHIRFSTTSPLVRFDPGILRTSTGRLTYFLLVPMFALFGAISGLALALTFVLVNWLVPVVQAPARLSRLESMLSSGLEFWLMSWLESVVMPQLEPVLLSGLMFGLAVMLVRGLLVGLEGASEIAPSPSVLARQCIRYHVSMGLASGLVIGIGTGLWCGQRLGLVFGLALGIATGLALGLGFGLRNGGSGWLRYAIGVRAAVRRDLLPRRPARFLDWCLRAGLMRMAGSSLQFRHRQLQDWLTSPAVRAEQAEREALSRLRAARHRSLG